MKLYSSFMDTPRNGTIPLSVPKNIYDSICFGTKKIMFKLREEKDNKLKIGNIVLLRAEDNRGHICDSCEKQIVALYEANTFKELFDGLDVSLLTDQMITKQELLTQIEKDYPIEEQKKLGVIGIHVNNITCPECGGKVVPWVYGSSLLPETIEKANRGEVMLAGRIIDDIPKIWHCTNCNSDYDKEFTLIKKIMAGAA